ncbi:MAG: D-2-hydroxyacid dehydrogenase [Chloroflexi bacterium]|nr:D-2-hydroxyacid dehydrogenase [Chloroflexota bacterium]
MEKVNVLVVCKSFMHEGFLKDIEAVDPRIVVKDATGLFAQELRQDGMPDPSLEDEAQRDLARGLDPGTGGQSLDSLLEEAEVIFATFKYPKNLLSRAPRLKWCQFQGSGIDKYVNTEIMDGRIRVTNSREASGIPIGEHVIGLVFALARNIQGLHLLQMGRHWGPPLLAVELNGKTLGILGMGAIGTQAARIARGIGMRVIGTRRSATEREHDVGYFDEVYPCHALIEMLAACDFVALTLPLTAETRKLIGEKELRAMKPSAFIINTSRGAIIDEPVLIRALKEGWIAGAGLDVTEQEPLPPESDLWGMPNVVLSPHQAAHTDRRSYHISRLFCENLKRYISGEPLVNVVTRERGY